MGLLIWEFVLRRNQYDFYISPFKLWQLTGYVYQRDEIEFQKMEERKKAKKKG